MKKYLLTPLVFLPLIIFAQDKIHVSGFVKDKISGEMLIGALVYDTATVKGTATDYNGYFSFVGKADATIKVSYVGYNDRYVRLSARDTVLNLSLEQANELKEVTVVGNQITNLNTATISVGEIEQIPSITGKPDFSKSLQAMPGITSQNEASSLLLVRGGDPGQNLYLMDNVPVIYVNHLGGFMSVFNSDIINAVDVYKGGFPARYGGKLSSIVDITQREGNVNEYKGSLSIGLMDLSFAVEGPIKKDTSSFIITGRKTMFDLLYMGLTYFDDDVPLMVLGFHDINAKYTYKPSYKEKLSFNFYYGDDYISLWTDNLDNDTDKIRYYNVWGNILASLHYKTMLSDKIHSSSSLSYNRYRLKEYAGFVLDGEEDSAKTYSVYNTAVHDVSLRSNIKYSLSDNWKIETGLQSSVLAYQPTSHYSNEEPKSATEYIYSSENALYLENRIKLLRSITMNLGARGVYFMSDDYYDLSLEPRASLDFRPNSRHVFMATYMRAKQYSHLLLTPGRINSSEAWLPAGDEVAPSYTDQVSLGWGMQSNTGMFRAEANLYYKTLYDLSIYKEGYGSLKGDTDWYEKIETGGEGLSYGAEVLLKKQKGRLKGFAGYTLSKTTRQFDNINNGKAFVFDYDRTHSISLSSQYKISDRYTLNMAWYYQTGLPYTPTIGRHFVRSAEKSSYGDYFYYESFVYGERNSGRMRDYHRLDIALNIHKTTKRGRRAMWTLSLYNAYNRQNPISYYLNNNDSNEIYRPEYGQKPVTLKQYQYSMFPIIPSVSYKVFFDKRENYVRKPFNESLKQFLHNLLYHQ